MKQKVGVGCLIEKPFVGEGDFVKASCSVEQFGFTVGEAYAVRGISSENNLIIENNNGETGEYAPVHFY